MINVYEIDKFSFSATISSISFGVNSGWSSPYLPYLLSNSSSIPTTDWEGSWCATSLLVGCFIGAILAANVTDYLGRRNSMLLTAPLTFIGFFGMAFAQDIWALIGLKMLIGVTDGIMYTILPMYVGEIVDPDIRGFLSSVIHIFYITGNLFINVIGPFTSIFTSSLISAGVPALHFLLMLFMPESPYQFVRKGEYERAEYSLKVLKGEENVKSDLNDIIKIIDKEREYSATSKLTDIFTIPSNRMASYIFLLVVLANKMSGKTPIQFYTTIVFSETGSTIDATLSTIIYNAVELLVVFIVTFFILDRFGKRPLMIISCSGSFLTILALAFYFFLRYIESSFISNLNWLPITSLVGYNILFSIGLGFGPSIYVCELFPMNVKANASCLAELTNVVLSLVSSFFFQLTADSVGMYFPFLCFAITCGVCVMFFFKMVPETKGKSLGEIQEFLIANSKVKS